LGSIVALSDNHGTTKGSYTYDAFGNYVQPEPPPPPSSVTNPFRYTARELDSETGLYYYRARYYDPSAGRFLSEDPARFVGGINAYPYVSNNPVDLVDPMGLAGGPKGPRAPTRCYWQDSCSTLLGKMQLLQRTIKSHSGWDWHVPKPRGGGRHAEEIANFWRAFARCQEIYLSKCMNQKCPEVLRLEEESARQMEKFWKVILFGLPAIPIGYALPALAPAIPELVPVIPKLGPLLAPAL
jgi:RHS repeat-associated protein